ncbi:hypothetical protein GOV03_05090 [Candidatus Woesearchaeota archaeon]|nr:hypothetical protein [Candidatus Woesearchaeota archaeon]
MKNALFGLGLGILSLVGCGPSDPLLSPEVYPSRKVERLKEVQERYVPDSLENISKVEPEPFLRPDICEGVLPVAYEVFLKKNPRVTNSLIWVNNDNPEGITFASDCDALEDLAAHLKGDIEILEPLVGIPSSSGQDHTLYLEEDAWDMYLTHIAHSLKLEVEKVLPWSIKDYDQANLALIFDGKNFIKFLGGLNNHYKFDDSGQGGRVGVTDWNPLPAYTFLYEENILAETQIDTIYNLTQWIRAKLVHHNTSTPFNWDGYIGFPPVEKILYPPEGERHWTQGCYATTSLYTAILHTVNIPVRRNYTLLGNSIKTEDEIHTRFEFPIPGIGMVHGDDPYNILARRGINEVPVSKLFMGLGEINELIDNPEIDLNDGFVHTIGEIASYTAQRRQVEAAFQHRADIFMIERAREILGIKQNALDNFLIPYNGGDEDQPYFWKPLFSEEERQVIREGIDQTLIELGDGDIEEGCYRLFERRREYTIP